MESDEDLTRIRREIEIMASLKHKHIVQILEGSSLFILQVFMQIANVCSKEVPFSCGDSSRKARFIALVVGANNTAN